MLNTLIQSESSFLRQTIGITISAAGFEDAGASSPRNNVCDKMTEMMHGKQIGVLDKTDKMLDMEIAKLKLEMKLIEKQMHDKP